MTKDLRLKIYPAVIAILGLSLVALMLSRIQIQIANNSATPESVPTNSEIPPPPQPESIPSPLEAPASSPSPTATPSPVPSVAPSPIQPVDTQGGLRVSNQTAYPVRLALLSQQAGSAGSDAAYGQPVHWDFAPEEGEAKGLILSLPNSALKLQTGDVLVAFAQDGSRRYWGPYIIGKTEAPVWDAKQKAWLLILQP